MREKNERHSDNRPVFARRTFRLPVVSLPGASTHANISPSRSAERVIKAGTGRVEATSRKHETHDASYPGYVLLVPVVGFSLVFCYFFYFFGRGQPLSRGARFRLSRRAAQLISHPSIRARVGARRPKRLFLSSFGGFNIPHPRFVFVLSLRMYLRVLFTALVHPDEGRSESERSGRVAQPWMGSGSLGEGVAVPSSRGSSVRARLEAISALRLVVSSSRARLRSASRFFFVSRSSIILRMRSCLSSCSRARFSSRSRAASSFSLRACSARRSSPFTVPSCAASLTSMSIVFVEPSRARDRNDFAEAAPPRRGAESRRNDAPGLRAGGANIDFDAYEGCEEHTYEETYDDGQHEGEGQWVSGGFKRSPSGHSLSRHELEKSEAAWGRPTAREDARALGADVLR